MCGIGGIYTLSTGTYPRSQIGQLWHNLDNRGGHDAGISWLTRGSTKPRVLKRPLRAAKMQQLYKREVGNKVQYAMLHTRYATQGNIKQTGNNHPVVSHGIILTHNGVLWNDDEIFTVTNARRLHEVDSEAINVALRFYGIEWVADNLHGSMSIAWVDITKDTQVVNLFTNGQNPLVIGRTISGHVVWASTKKHLAHMKLKSCFNATPFKLYKITPDGKIESRYISDQRENCMDLDTIQYYRYSGESVKKTSTLPLTTQDTKASLSDDVWWSEQDDYDWYKRNNNFHRLTDEEWSEKYGEEWR